MGMLCQVPDLACGGWYGCCMARLAVGDVLAWLRLVLGAGGRAGRSPGVGVGVYGSVGQRVAMQVTYTGETWGVRGRRLGQAVACW